MSIARHLGQSRILNADKSKSQTGKATDRHFARSLLHDRNRSVVLAGERLDEHRFPDRSRRRSRRQLAPHTKRSSIIFAYLQRLGCGASASIASRPLRMGRKAPPSCRSLPTIRVAPPDADVSLVDRAIERLSSGWWSRPFRVLTDLGKPAAPAAGQRRDERGQRRSARRPFGAHAIHADQNAPQR